MKKRTRRRVLFVVLLGLLAVLFIKSDWLTSLLYPIHYKEDIRVSARNYGVETHLIAAIIRTESNFKTGRESRKGALGIMQVMPDTASWIVEKAGLEKISEEMLRNRADIGIEMGAWYLNFLHKQFDGNSIAAIAAYNAGQGNVRKWLSSGTWDGTIESVKEIPFGETRHYVQRVYYYYNKYKKHYPDL